jgi:hypothetical protein
MQTERTAWTAGYTALNSHPCRSCTPLPRNPPCSSSRDAARQIPVDGYSCKYFHFRDFDCECDHVVPSTIGANSARASGGAGVTTPKVAGSRQLLQGGPQFLERMKICSDRSRATEDPWRLRLERVRGRRGSMASEPLRLGTTLQRATSPRCAVSYWRPHRTKGQHSSTRALGKQNGHLASSVGALRKWVRSSERDLREML